MPLHYLGESKFNLEWILENSTLAIHPNLAPEIAAKSEIIAFSESESGQMSDIFRIILPKLPNSSEKFNLIVKICVSSASIPDRYITLIHNSECTFYDVFGPVPDSGLPLAECLLSQKFDENQNQNLPGIIAVKDLKEQADFVTLWDGLSLGQVRSFVAALAKFHAKCLKDPDVWLDKFHDRVACDFNLTVGFFEMARSVLPENFPDLFTPAEIQGCRWTPEEGESLIHAFKDQGIPPILAHGDPWANNLMYRKSPDGGVTEELVAVIDWQESHPGTLTEDIARMLVTSVPASFRREHTDDLLRFYTEELRAGLGPEAFPEIGLSMITKLFHTSMKLSLGCYCMEFCLLLGCPVFQGEENVQRIAEMASRLKAAMEDVIGARDE